MGKQRTSKRTCVGHCSELDSCLCNEIAWGENGWRVKKKYFHCLGLEEHKMVDDQ